ncbi:hypothetical protein MNBD_GAMMA03-1837 [hydrothermal vent metagenome]|uniref:Roadblock/LAMTOR2 domain-containing protein n=1 Tax=hydrothermal vent metagenome TaxID=652676 RepID=A0A3B0WDN5_9ZZZZ
MSEHTTYLLPTPAGAYYLTQDNTENWQKDVLKRLFSLPASPVLNNATLTFLLDTTDKDNLVYKREECQKLQLLQVIEQEIFAPAGHLENNLKNLMHVFSKKQKVLLSDSQGFCIANHGFPTEMSEEISVLSADIAIMHKRRAIKINEKLGLNSQAWSIVDASGNSCLGFWPLNINDEVFVLAIEGVPFFNQPAMISLVWMLYLRYGS